MAKNVLLITQDWGRRRFRKMYGRLQQRGGVVVVAFSSAAQQLCRSEGVAFKQVLDYADSAEEFDLTRVAVAELNKYSARPVKGKPLGDWLSYQGLPLWNFISPNLFADVNTLFKSVTIFEKILRMENPDCVFGLDTSVLPPWFSYLRGVSKEGVVLDRLAQQICHRDGIQWRGVAPSLGLRCRHVLTDLAGRAITFFRGGVCIMVGAALLRKLLGGIAHLLLRSRHGDDGWPKVLFFSHKKYWRMDFNPIRNQVARTDTAIYPVVQSLSEQGGYQIRGIDGNYGFFGGLRILFEKLFCEPDLSWQAFDWWYPIAGFWKYRKKIRATKQVLEDRKALSSVFSYKGYELGDFFLPRLEFLLCDYLWKSAIWIEAGRAMIRRERPALVALSYETGTLSRAIINACHEAGIPTLGMQHGAFSNASDDYVRSPENHLPRFVPDKTAVWGERFKRIMVEDSAFSDDEVVVTGNPKMDFLVKAQSLLDKEKICSKYGLDPGRKLVLAAPTETIGRTQHLAKDRFFAGVLAAKRELGHYQWVTKLKPGAESKKYYQGIMRSQGETGLILTEDDLYPLLAAADLVITPPSSIAIEALIIGKPVIYTAFSDAEDYFPHLVEHEVVFPLYEIGNLPRMIESVMGLESSAAPAAEKLQDLLEEENFRADGRASSRVVEALGKLLEQSERNPVRPPLPLRLASG